MKTRTFLHTPALDLSILRIEKTVHFQDICFIDWFVFGDFIKKIVRFGMPCRLVDITKRLAAYGETVFNDDFCFAFRQRIALQGVACVGSPTR